MPVPSLQDFVQGVDLTVAVNTSGAQLMTLVSAGYPYDDKGMVVTTPDVNGVAQVPDANTNTKWQRYIWRRVTATDTIAYIWNPNIQDGTYLKWVKVFTTEFASTNNIDLTSVADGSIPGSKIQSLNYGQLVGAPASLPPTGNAGGHLTGVYPNPTLNQAVQSIVAAMLNPAGLKANQLFRVKSDLSGFEGAHQGVIQRVVQTVNTQQTTTNTSTGGAPTSAQGSQLFTKDFTPLSDTSIIRIACTGWLGITSGGVANAQLALFYNNILQAYTQAVSNNGSGVLNNHSAIVEAYVSSWGAGTAKTIKAMLSTTNATYAAIYNLTNSVGVFTIEEVMGSLN